MSHKYIIDYGDYDGSKKHRHVMSFVDKFPEAARKLKETIITLPGMPELLEKRVKNGESRYFILHKVTTTTDAKKFLTSYERWNVCAIMNGVKMNKEPAKQKGLK